MKCTYVALEGGGAAIVCGGRRFPAKRCDCGKEASKLCDWIIAKPVPPYTNPTTCNHPMCADCAFPASPKKDLCPPHRDAWAVHPKNPKNAKEPTT